MDVCKLEDFKHAFMLMDELIDNEINSGNDEYKETDPLIVKAIGGFALLYHELRLSAVTADVDSTVMIPNCYKTMIKKTAKQLDMPEDWLNDHSQSGIAAIDGKWDLISWNLKHIQIYVLNTRELMIDKCGWAEKNLSGSMLTDRDEAKDHHMTVVEPTLAFSIFMALTSRQFRHNWGMQIRNRLGII